jgi:hypothetical protein
VVRRRICSYEPLQDILALFICNLAVSQEVREEMLTGMLTTQSVLDAFDFTAHITNI